MSVTNKRMYLPMRHCKLRTEARKGLGGSQRSGQ